CLLGHPLQPYEPPARAGVRHPQDLGRRGPHQARARRGPAARQPDGAPRLRLRGRLRRRDVADAAAARGRGLRGRYRGSAQHPGGGRDRLRRGRARLAPLRAAGPGGHPRFHMSGLVTGIGGVAGPPVAHALLAKGHAVEGVLRAPLERPRLAGLPLTLHALDLLDRERLRAVLAERRPDAVLHLAGLSFAPAAERDPEAAYRANLGGTLAVLAAVRSAAPRARVLAVTSAEVYGAVAAAELPITEDIPLRPLTVYGASKAAADLAAAQCGRAYGLD